MYSVLNKNFKLMLLALYVYECWSRCVGKKQIEQVYYQSTNYSYILRELLRISTDYTYGEGFSVSQQYCSRSKFSGMCHCDMG
jgi:hypothetical protein